MDVTPLFDKQHKQQRQSTPAELCKWLNELSAKVRTGVNHFVHPDTNRIWYQTLGDNGKVIEQGEL